MSQSNPLFTKTSALANTTVVAAEIVWGVLVACEACFASDPRARRRQRNDETFLAEERSGGGVALRDVRKTH